MSVTPTIFYQPSSSSIVTQLLQTSQINSLITSRATDETNVSTLNALITAQATAITALQTAVTTLTGQITDLTTTANSASNQATNCANALHNLYNNGTLNVSQINFISTAFVMKPYQRTDVGGSGWDMAIMFDDGTRMGNGAIFGMYIGSDGRCFMEDSHGIHQIAVQ